jgi:polysaccharide biosynthesis transport protein
MADTSLDNERLSVEHRVENRANATDLRQLFTVLLRRRLLILSLFCIPLSASSFLALMAKPTYQSSMQLLVSSNLYQGQNSNAQGGVEESDFTDSNLKVDYTAQLSVMTSPKLVERAVELLRPEYPNITVEEINGKPAKVKQSPLKVTQVESGTKTLQTLSQVFVSLRR